MQAVCIFKRCGLGTQPFDCFATQQPEWSFRTKLEHIIPLTKLSKHFYCTTQDAPSGPRALRTCPVFPGALPPAPRLQFSQDLHVPSLLPHEARPPAICEAGCLSFWSHLKAAYLPSLRASSPTHLRKGSLPASPPPHLCLLSLYLQSKHSFFLRSPPQAYCCYVPRVSPSPGPRSVPHKCVLNTCIH